MTADARRIGPRLAFVAAVVLIEGLALTGYGIFVIVELARLGITGPAAVSNPASVTLEIIIFLAMGIGLLVSAWGLWQGRRWARAPSVLAQILALVVGVPLIGAVGGVERTVGIVLSALAVVTVVVLLTPGMTRDLSGENEEA